jgi:hypothetical protein
MAFKPVSLGTSDWRKSREDKHKANRICYVHLGVCHAVILRLVGTKRRVDICRERTSPSWPSPDARERCGCCPPPDTKGGLRHRDGWSSSGRRLRILPLSLQRSGLCMSTWHIFPWGGWPPAPLSVSRGIEASWTEIVADHSRAEEKPNAALRSLSHCRIKGDLVSPPVSYPTFNDD